MEDGGGPCGGELVQSAAQGVVVECLGGDPGSEEHGQVLVPEHLLDAEERGAVEEGAEHEGKQARTRRQPALGGVPVQEGIEGGDDLQLTEDPCDAGHDARGPGDRGRVLRTKGHGAWLRRGRASDMGQNLPFWRKN